MVEKMMLVDRVNKIIGKRIEFHRTSLRLSQYQVANRCGLSRTYLSDIERGLRSLSVVSLCKIAYALNMRASDVLEQAELQAESDRHEEDGHVD